jgi:hypothetical protein
MPPPAADWIRDAVAERAAELALSAYAIAKATNGAATEDSVRRYLTGATSLSSARLAAVLTVLGLTLAAADRPPKKYPQKIR